MRGLILVAALLVSGQAWAGEASWYSVEACKWNKDKACPTASGKSLYKLEADEVMFAAMWTVPFGTRFLVTNEANGKSVEVVIEDRGPAKRLNREIDLSKAAFGKIADTKQGLITVSLKRL